MFNKYCLENGVRVVTYRMPEMKSVSVGLWVEAGSRNEDESNNGVSHFIEHMLFKGTKKRSARKIAETFDAIGGQINAFTGKEATCFYTKTLGKYLDLSMDVLSDIFFNSLFDQEEMNLEKSVVVEEIGMYEDAPEELVHDVMAEVVWKKSLGYPILGTEKNVESFGRKEVVNYKDKNYTANRLVLSIAGNFEEEKVKKLVNKYFSNWESTISKNRYEENTFHTGTVIRKKDTEQAHFCISFPGYESKNDLNYSASALNNILGGGMSSRLFQEIREKRGLAYSIYSYTTAYMKEGLLTIYGGISPENYEVVNELIEKEIYKLVTKKLSDREIKNAKEQLKGGFLLGFENTTSVMSYAGKSELQWGKIETPEEVIEKIEKIDDESIEKVKEKVFASGKVSRAIIGQVEV